MKNTIKLYINSGICKCGHYWDEHHLCIIVRQSVADSIKSYVSVNCPNKTWRDSVGNVSDMYPPYVPGECEHYGFNECGGLMPSNGSEWADHCRNYRDKDGILGEVELLD